MSHPHASRKKPSTLPCFKCEKVLEGNGSGEVNSPSGACSFTTTGHYGTTVFDPMDGSMLEINICDDCLSEAAKQNRIILYEPITAPRRKFKTLYWAGVKTYE